MNRGLTLTLTLALAAVLSACTSLPGSQSSPLSRHGQLSIHDRTLVDVHGQPVQLRGFSTQTLSSGDIFMSPRYLAELRDSFSCDVVRGAMYVDDRIALGYLTNPPLKRTMETLVNDATDAGLYAIIDWHILIRDHNPLTRVDEAVAFFSEMAQEFHDHTNVFYEICNEPNGDDVTWEGQIRPYAERVIAAIRKYDTHNIVIVGTPNWSSDVDQAALDPLPDPLVMYTVHFYPGTHKQDARDKVSRALERVPVFCTEFGTTDSSGNGSLYPDELKVWMDFLDKNNISWCNWNLSSFSESSAALEPRFQAEEDSLVDLLSPSGKLIRTYMKRGRQP